MSFTHETLPFVTYTWEFTSANDGSRFYEFNFNDVHSDTRTYASEPTMNDWSLTVVSGPDKFERIESVTKTSIKFRLKDTTSVTTYRVSYSLGIDRLVQTGTDNDLSDLKNHNNAVDVVEDDGVTYYHIPTAKMKIVGTVFHDPEKEVLLFHKETTEGFAPAETLLSINEALSIANTPWKNPTSIVKNSDGSVTYTIPGHGYSVGNAVRTQSTVGGNLANQKLRVEEVIDADNFKIGRGYFYEGPTDSQSNLGRLRQIPCYNYGAEYTFGDRTRYSVGCGLMFTGGSTSNWDPDEYAFAISGSTGGYFWSRGGTIATQKPADMSGGYDMIGTTISSTRRDSNGNPTPIEIRNMGTGFFTKSKLVNVSGINVTSMSERNIALEGGALSEVLGGWWEASLLDFDVSNNANGVDIGHDGSGGYHHHDYEIINSANGSNIIAMWRPATRSSTAQRGVVATKKQVSFSIKDASDNPIEGVEMYVVDNPSEYAKRATFEAQQVSGSYTTTPTQLDATINSDGSITYDYLDPISYTGTTDSNGEISTMKILTSIQIKEYNNAQSGAIFPNTTLPDGVTENRYHGEFGYVISVRPNGYWRLDPSTTQGPTFADWDTDNFGGFYKVDRRSNDNTDADEFTFKFASYNHTLAAATQPCRGLGELRVNWTLFDDLVISELDRTVVDGYTEITTPEQFYDRAKAFLVDNYEGESETIVSRNGDVIHIGNYDLDIDTDASAPVFAFDGSKITIKSSTFVGSITTTGGVIQLLNGAVVVGTYGDISVLPFTITNVEAGSTVQLYNVTNDNEIVNDVVTGTANTKVTFSGIYANSLAEPDDEIRLRITCQSGATALLPYESFGVATAAGISFKANQVDDVTYNSNAIDGSAANYDNTSLQIAADFTNFELDVSDTDDPGSVTTQQIYAKYAYLVTTAEGIDKFFGAITADNPSNYKINTSVVDLKIQNISSSDMIITGARLYRDDNTTVIKKGPSGAGTLSHDTGEFLQYIQPQVEAATQSIKRNTNLIPGLF